ncbi:ABC transporter ATP-binding protein [Demequina sp. TTPB684]|uniref:ABC transporter ATP-binding protein n=1 Tax=unclassified Demequina TaxID=2620311 RepID=UPI001CF2E37A|nr:MULTISPECIES: ABC transporter ATP-binding protein [unclassified Demequina]MCB2412982.1 ABC transporter ATP-binding protein [Demequina sp. TTPB684]UPU88332.1 ABC transporter ATP-binding protein [Demequina sp. TMPB413]
MSADVRLEAVTQGFTRRGSHRAALAEVTLDIAAGEFVAVVGPSGCGKSTLLDLIAGHARPATGSVTVGGTPVTGPGPQRMLVFQEHALFPWLTVQANVEFGLRSAGVEPARRAATANEWIARVGLADAAHLHPHELSGGMRQRAALARAFALAPQVLLMDEPFSALDAPSRDRLHVELQDLWRETGTTIVFVTHNVREAVTLGDRVVVMSSGPGRIIAEVGVTLPRPRVVESGRVVDLAQHVRGLLDEADQMGITAPRQGRDGYVSI